MIKDVLYDFAGYVGGRFDKLSKDVENLKKAAAKSKVSDAPDKASLHYADGASFRFGNNLSESEFDTLLIDQLHRDSEEAVTLDGKELRGSMYMNTAFTTFRKSSANGLYRPLSVRISSGELDLMYEPDVLNLVESRNLDGVKITIPNASSVAVMTARSVGVGVRNCDYVLRVRTIQDTEDYKEKQMAAWGFPTNGSGLWSNESGKASFSDGVLTFGSNLGAAIVAVSFEDGSRAVYKIAAKSSVFQSDKPFKTRTWQPTVEAVAGGTSQEALDGFTRYEWGEGVVYPAVPDVGKFYLPEDANLSLNPLDGEMRGDEFRVLGGSILLPDGVTEAEVIDTVRATAKPLDNTRIKRPVITLPKGTEYRFKIKNLKMPCLLGNVSTASDGTVTVSANATEKDSVFGDALHIVIV
ncbi:hypothetical protein [Neisseria polysaccharea]|uniref:hypothetical protein n=1 Tax=Neisseria polysaccharea TaxID=489 RepID=UPI0027E1DD89|nr:hypothetical protein [Neisseria polysaccharea]